MTQTLTGMATKAQLRKTYLDRRAWIAPDKFAAASDACCARLVEFIQTHIAKGSIVAGFMPFRGEVHIVPALITLAYDYRLALPAVERDSKELHFRAWKPGDRLIAGPYGTGEPNDDALRLVPHAVIVPLLVFDRKKDRLGYGGGYYDRTLEQLRKTQAELKTIGAAFALQEAEYLPLEPHDVTLDAIVTEKEVIA